MASLDFNFENVSDSFTVAGNGVFYGFFSYAQVPLTLGPLSGDNATRWEFLVRDADELQVLDYVNVGSVDCSSGIFTDPEKTKTLEIMYGEQGAHFICPPGASEFTIWTYDGRLIHSDHKIASGEKIWVSKYLSAAGLFFVRVKARDKMFVGKLVGFKE
jgi:hypothetical protein